MDDEVCNKLIVFTRFPEPGKVKTRLIPALGEVGAAELHRKMTEYTLKVSQELVHHRLVALDVHYAGADKRQMKKTFGADLCYVRQSRNRELGQRMFYAFKNSFRQGVEKVVIIGTDCPELTAKIILQAFDELTHSSLVLGPAKDGGYYLIGLRNAVPQLFDGIPWGTREVLKRTLEAARRHSLAPILLIPLDDVDRPEDLHICQHLNDWILNEKRDGR